MILLFCGTAAFEGSVLWWCRDHRAHHRFVDTPKDPYSIKKGFFWAHMGWLLVKQKSEEIGKVDASDLESDTILRFQDKYFALLSVLIGFVFPTIFCGVLFGDYRGGFFFAAVARTVMVMQSTFCINSLAHYFGNHPFDDQRSAADSWWVSFITFGEGYHNFHHQFPYDYRNGVKPWAFDPSKWLIWILSVIGGTHNLKRFPREEIEKCELQMKEIKLQEQMKQYNWGPKPQELPVYTQKELEDRVAEGASLLVIDGIVHDVCEFLPTHPGGPKILRNYLGKDATGAFNGAVYSHSRVARNILAKLRVGRMQ